MVLPLPYQFWRQNLLDPYHWKWYNSSINETNFMQHESENTTKAMQILMLELIVTQI
jgi:hypothetical protein